MENKNNDLFFLNESTGPEIGNDFPQATEMVGDIKDGNSVNDVYELSKFIENLPDFNPKIGRIILSRTARVTDVISSVHFNSFIGKIVNEKALSVFLEGRLPPYLYFPVTVTYGELEFKYYWLHIVTNMYKIIDFDKSTYMIASAIGKKIESIHVQSYDDYKVLRKKLDTSLFLKPEMLYLKSADIDLDMFKVGVGLNQFIINKKMKNKLEANNISGIDTQPLPNWVIIE